MPESGPQAPDDLKAILLFSALFEALKIFDGSIKRKQS
jgi:hypothetical protein